MRPSNTLWSCALQELFKMITEIDFVIKSWLMFNCASTLFHTCQKNNFVKKTKFIKCVITKCTHYIATMAGNVSNVLFEITLLIIEEYFVKLHVRPSNTLCSFKYQNLLKMMTEIGCVIGILLKAKWYLCDHIISLLSEK